MNWKTPLKCKSVPRHLSLIVGVKRLSPKSDQFKILPWDMVVTKMDAQKLGCRLHSKYMIRVINRQRLIITGDTGFFQGTLHGIDYYIVLFTES